MLQYETACSHSHQTQPQPQPQQQQQQQPRKQTYKEYLQQHQQQKQQQQQQSKQPVRIFRVHYIRLNSKDGSSIRNSATASAAAGSSSSSSCSSSGTHGVKMKTIAPNIRRRRRCDKHHLELYCNESAASGSGSNNAGGSNNLTLKPSGLRFRESITAPSTAASSPVDEQLCIPAPPITPPPAFLTEGYKRASTSVSTSALPSATQEQQQQLLRPKPLALAPPKLKPKTTATIAVTINSSRSRGTVKRSLGKPKGRRGRSVKNIAYFSAHVGNGRASCEWGCQNCAIFKVF